MTTSSSEEVFARFGAGGCAASGLRHEAASAGSAGSSSSSSSSSDKTIGELREAMRAAELARTRRRRKAACRRVREQDGDDKEGDG